ncbi:MAG: electron transport complex subunit E [Clostridia bacterium]|nr:electron transport complex subunit E [Clostridia bacterium]
MDEKKSKLQILTNGIIKENPTLVLLIGCCPFLATSTSAINGAGMGMATTAVLICSNIVISILKNVIPNRVRIPCYITIIAGFVTIVQFLLQAYLPDLNKSLGLFIPLIVVNCIILGRAEMFASKNSIFDSFLDGIGNGLGFTLALFCMGAIREFLGGGTVLGHEVTTNLIEPMTMFVLPAGGFFVFGVLAAVVNKITGGKLSREFSCAGCPGDSALADNADQIIANIKAAAPAAETKNAETPAAPAAPVTEEKSGETAAPETPAPAAEAPAEDADSKEGGDK